MFKNGLKEINTPYAHRHVTAWKLTAVPKEEPRKYEDRGWTEFESIIIDSKGGFFNKFTIGEDFDPAADPLSVPQPGESELRSQEDVPQLRHYKLWKGFAQARLRPPLTPAQFEARLDVMKTRAEERGLALFTNGKDHPFIIDKYKANFENLQYIDMLMFEGSGSGVCGKQAYDWGDKEVMELVEVLPYCKQLGYITLWGQQIGKTGGQAIIGAIEKLPKLQWLNVADNPFAKDSE